MNTKSLLTRIGVPVLSLGLLGGLGATLATSASAAVKPVTVTASTHLNNHPDTTSGSGLDANGNPIGALQPTGNGAVWAYDNATEKFTVTTVTAPTGTTPGTYQVAIDYVGNFHGFADPGRDGTTDPNAGYGAPLVSDGSVKGIISYRVQATQDPNAANLPGQSPSDAHLSDNINLLFGGNVVPGSIVQSGPYSFSYQNGNYVQADTIKGDVQGH